MSYAVSLCRVVAECSSKSAEAKDLRQKVDLQSGLRVECSPVRPPYCKPILTTPPQSFPFIPKTRTDYIPKLSPKIMSQNLKSPEYIRTSKRPRMSDRSKHIIKEVNNEL